MHPAGAFGWLGVAGGLLGAAALLGGGWVVLRAAARSKAVELATQASDLWEKEVAALRARLATTAADVASAKVGFEALQVSHRQCEDRLQRAEDRLVRAEGELQSLRGEGAAVSALHEMAAQLAAQQALYLDRLPPAAPRPRRKPRT